MFIKWYYTIDKEILYSPNPDVLSIKNSFVPELLNLANSLLL